MNAIVTIDNNGGVGFNRRRQSKDKKLIERVLKLAKGADLYCSEYSSGLFDEGKTIVSLDPAEDAGDNDWVFFENTNLEDFEDDIEQLAVFLWNRDYPADKYLGLDLEDWTLIKEEEFKGNSHDKITLQIYEK